MKLDVIKKTITEISFVKELIEINENNRIISGKVSVFFEGLEVPLFFDFEIYPQYPFKTFESESIKFRNLDLIELNHIMSDGSICIHTTQSNKLEEKIRIDFISLKQWIDIYYLNKNKEKKYEHIIVNEVPINGIYYSYLFTDLDYQFQKREYGEVELSQLAQSKYKKHNCQNFIVQNFISNKRKKIISQWSNHYKNISITHKGLFIFIKSHPAKYKKFAFENWEEMKGLIPENFLSFMNSFEQRNKKKYKNLLIPIFIGYEVTSTDIHWQVALIKIGQFPTIGHPIRKDGVKTGLWGGRIFSQKIDWAITKNTSYKYFFGRGTFSKIITNSKILVVGIGAIGSMLSKTLVKGGCKYIDVVDYDIKEPENVCRSEYLFSTGLTNKTDELIQILIANSPFVETNLVNNIYFENIKAFANDEKSKEEISKSLENYDIIFDCTTDDDLMYILNSIKIKSDIINLSITNHANELVCAFYPNIYHFVKTQFNEILTTDTTDLYEPTGCWSPTFRASYNDINTLLQIATKQINSIYETGKPKNNFVINQGGNQINIQEF